MKKEKWFGVFLLVKKEREFTLTSFPFTASFCSIDEKILHEALLEPITFL
jgi:hypothetical protein